MSQGTISELTPVQQQHEKELLKILGSSYADDIREALRMRPLGPQAFRPLRAIIEDMIRDSKTFDALWNKFGDIGHLLSLEKFELIKAAATIANVNQCASLIQRYAQDHDIARPLIVMLLDKVYESRVASLLAE